MARIRRLAAFSLIELLVVVGIVCILAAAAIPNLLDAQVRSKVARVKNDHKVIAEALERYWNDNDSYPIAHMWCGYHKTCPPHPRPKHTRCEWRNAEWLYHVHLLTTPVAYLTTTKYTDPFIKARAHRHKQVELLMVKNHDHPFSPDQSEVVPTIQPNIIDVPIGDERDPIYPTYTYSRFSPFKDEREVLGEISYYERSEFTEVHRPGYYLVSVGPDNISGPDAISGHLWNVHDYSWLNDHTEGQKNIFLEWQYDPSNGTISNGDIVRYGEYYRH